MSTTVNENASINANPNANVPTSPPPEHHDSDDEHCPEDCHCPPSKCYRWCIKRFDECTFEATKGDLTLLANSEKSLLALIKRVSEKEYVKTSPPCECQNNTNCSNKTYTPFSCVAREWIVQVEYRPECNQYFGECNLSKKCKDVSLCDC